MQVRDIISTRNHHFALQVPVYGRNDFELGALYDARTDKVILGQNLWKTSKIAQGKSIKKVGH